MPIIDRINNELNRIKDEWQEHGWEKMWALGVRQKNKHIQQSLWKSMNVLNFDFEWHFKNLSNKIKSIEPLILMKILERKYGVGSEMMNKVQNQLKKS